MTLSEITNQKHILLTTKGRRTGKAHTVELWYAILGEKIYLSHEGEYSDWMRNIQKDSQVKFKIGNYQFIGKARIVMDKKDFDIGKHALYLKYYGKASNDVIDDWFSESNIVEILIGK